MSPIAKRVLTVLFLLLLAFAIIKLHGGDDIPAAALPKESPQENEEAPGPAPDATPSGSESAEPMNAARPSATPAQGASAAVPASSREPSALPGISKILEKYSGTKDWHLDLDDKGRPFKMSGGKLKGIARSDALARQFIAELGEELGFKEPPVVERKVDEGPRMKLVDYEQTATSPDGQKLAVYQGWIRLGGDGAGDAIIVVNQLKPLNDVRYDLALSEDEAKEIARRHVNDTKATFKTGSVFVFADEAPHQKATQVFVGGVKPRRVLLVGHQTRTVVFEGLASFH